MMTSVQCNLAEVRRWILVICMMLATGALAQPSSNSQRADDMRLWSFGDCDRHYASADTPEHRECMRVVGSSEARDLRAQRVCEDSYQNYPTEIERCRTAYEAIKEKTARGSKVANAPAASEGPLTPEMERKVKAIALAAVEQSSVVAENAAPADAAVSPEGSSRRSLIFMSAFAMLLLGGAATIVLKNRG